LICLTLSYLTIKNQNDRLSHPATYCRATIWGIDITPGCIELQAACDNLSFDLLINIG